MIVIAIFEFNVSTSALFWFIKFSVWFSRLNEDAKNVVIALVEKGQWNLNRRNS